MASWNPALRPDTEAEAQEKSIENATHSQTSEIIERNAPASSEIIAKNIHNATESDWKFSRTQGSIDLGADDDFFNRRSSLQIPPVDVPAQESLDEDTSRIPNGARSRPPALEQPEPSPEILEAPDNTSLAELEQTQPVAESAPNDKENDQAHRAEENYEHQGETTFLEEAVETSAAIPLVDDAAPALEWEAADDSVAFDLQAESVSLAAAESEQQDLGWGETADGEDIDFGVKPVLVESVANNLTPTEDLATAQGDISWGASNAQDLDFNVGTTQDSNGSSKPEDIDALWAAALDDGDDFLADDNTGDRSAFLFDDNEGFLDDFAAQMQQSNETIAPTQNCRSLSQSSNKYAPAGTANIAQAVQPVNQYLPQGPQFTDLSRTQNTVPTRASAPSYGGYTSTYNQQQQQRPALASSAQSFADKAKGGYASPYDLPTDIAPKKRAAPNRPAVPASPNLPIPPPRSSSIPSNGGAPGGRPVPIHAQTTPQTGAASSPGMIQQNTPRSGSSGFFEELPAVPRTRPSASGRYTPQPSPAPFAAAPPQSLPQNQNDPSVMAGLRQPERLPAYTDQTPTHPQVPGVPLSSSRFSPAPPVPPTSNARYSPAPPHAPATAPPVASKYAPSPANVPPSAPYQSRISSDPISHPRSQSQSFLPRTSSPLAQHHVTREPEEINLMPPPPVPVAAAKTTSEAKPSTPPPPRSVPSSMSGSPSKQSKYAPQQSVGGISSTPAPARRQSSSPSTTTRSPPQTATTMPYQTAFPVNNVIPESPAPLPARTGFSNDLAFIPPSDETAHDPLERWRGHPVFRWGLGGTIVTSFPIQVPRYGNGSSAPMIKCSPGEVKVSNVKTVAPLADSVTKFPGPLKSKGKKKDVVAWLKAQIDSLDKDYQGSNAGYALDDTRLRQEERLMLWRILTIFVEHDGKLEGSPTVEQAVRAVLSPAPSEEPQTAAEDAPAAKAEPVNSSAIEKLRQFLVQGDREKAAWYAADQRLWGHAMLISSTLSQDIWKQVIQDFVRREVKKVGSGNEPLAALYEVFAGNWSDSIDQLVPVSARAGFQMINTSGISNNTLEGLDKWRETLHLILTNRSNNDEQALLSLSKLLAQYHRTDAAHICALFARSKAHFSGADDIAADVVLLGANHRAGYDVATDIEAIVLTEVYEFALTLSPNTFAGLPHLQPYKLAHAYALAEYGYRNDAQKYCDGIASTIKSSTKSSPYYNSSFIGSLDDLSKRLSQAPKDGSSSWFSKPSMDKVSGSFLNRFTSFVAGDDSDGTSQHSGAGPEGPYATISGNTPTISPTQSSADLYGQFRGPAALISPQQAANGSRYGPTSAYNPTQPADQPRGPYAPQNTNGYTPNPVTQDHTIAAQSSPYAPSFTASQYSPSSSQIPIPSRGPNRQSSSGFEPSSYGHSAYGASPYHPSPLSASLEGPSDPVSQQALDANVIEDAPSNAPIVDSVSGSAYDPHNVGSYEPPAYIPYEPEKSDNEAEKAPKSKKKSFMDLDGEDDEMMKQAATLKKQQRAQADKEAEDNFRKAAEADAAKAQAGGDKKGGWFGVGGWFKKDPNAAQPGAIKAKLGEENSFVYDEATKKWVNKKAGAAAPTASAPTPPPPKGPPSRVPSGASATGTLPASGPSLGGPPKPPTSGPPTGFALAGSGPPSRVGTPASAASGEGGEAAPPLTRPNLGGLPTGPPSRPGTGMSNASSIDDLLGAPQARKGGASKKPKRAGRYVDVMGAK